MTGTCVDGEASLPDEHLRTDRRGGLELVQALGDLKKFAGGINPIEEPVDQEDNSSCRYAVLDHDGGFQINLKRTPVPWRDSPRKGSVKRLQKILTFSNPLPNGAADVPF